MCQLFGMGKNITNIYDGRTAAQATISYQKNQKVNREGAGWVSEELRYATSEVPPAQGHNRHAFTKLGKDEGNPK